MFHEVWVRNLEQGVFIQLSNEFLDAFICKLTANYFLKACHHVLGTDFTIWTFVMQLKVFLELFLISIFENNIIKLFKHMVFVIYSVLHWTGDVTHQYLYVNFAVRVFEFAKQRLTLGITETWIKSSETVLKLIEIKSIVPLPQLHLE